MMNEKVKVQETDPQTQDLILDRYKARLTFARFGDVGCFMPTTYRQDADNFRNMAVRPDDVWVVTFPRSGTTWTQELVWLLMNSFDYDTASKIPLMGRYLFLEVKHLARRNDNKFDHLEPNARQKIFRAFPSYEDIANSASPRFIKTHLHLSILPPTLLDTTKVVYVARDPRDVAVSFYHHNRLIMDYVGDFKSYWNLFHNDLVLYSPYFPHLKEAWALRHHPNMLFIFYEDMIKDLPACIKQIAKFLGKEVTDEQIVRLCEHLDIKNFRNNESVNMAFLQQLNPDAEGFVRKGKSAGWRDYFDEEMAAQAQRWMRDNLADTDLRFPDNSSNVATLVSLYNK